MKDTKEFSGLRKVIWPIHAHELKKFVPLALIFFFISFNYSVLRNLKDIFMINLAGPEAMYYTKMWGVTPVVILYTILYNNLVHKWGRHKMFYAVVAYFFTFISLFMLFMYPNIGALQWNSFPDAATAMVPKFRGLWQMLRYWTLALFYVHAELWGTYGLSIIFWTFTNEITNVKQSRRFYSFLALGANMALLFSGGLLKFLGGKEHIGFMVYLVIASMLIIMVLYRWLTGKIFEDPNAYGIEERSKKKKAKLSMSESFKAIIKSRYLRLVAVLVFAYGLVISLIEAVWKGQIKALQVSMGGDVGVLSTIYANEVILIGITTLILIFTASSWIVAKSWKLGALITPMVAAIVGAMFFAFMLFGQNMTFFTTMFGVSTLMLSVVFGMLQVVFIKAFKYTLFDPTKEATYIPLDDDSKTKGKAAVDGIGGRLGKSGGAFLLTFFLIPFVGNGDIGAATPWIAVIVAVALGWWMYSVGQLDVEYKKAIADNEAEKTK